MTAERDTLVGEIVCGHELVRLLGRGGMGEVYLARHTELHALRAIKVIHDDLRCNQEAVARFRLEALATARLSHPCIITLFDFGTLPNGWPFLCMEYVDGMNLHTRVQTAGPMSISDTVSTLRQVARALVCAHAEGIVHRDLKPENIIQTTDAGSGIKVIDFGLVRLLSDEMVARITKSAQLLGSPEYMAPEQATGSKDVERPADIYALGGIGYYLLSGRPVFRADTLFLLLHAHREEEPQRLSTRLTRVEIPPLLDDLLLACVAKDPAQRPSAQAVLAVLDRVVPSDSEQQEPSAPTLGVGSEMNVEGTIIGTERLPWQLRAKRAEEALLGAESPDPSGMLEAIGNQVQAVVTDIAGALAPSVHRLGELARERDRLQQELEDLEIQMVVETDNSEALAQRRAELRERLRIQVGLLVRGVEMAREAREREAAALYDELDRLLDRLEKTLRSSHDG